MASVADAAGIDASGLRARLPSRPDEPQLAESPAAAEAAVRALNATEDDDDRESHKRTYGRTLDGTVFTVPHTEDMVSQLFDPTQAKNASDVAILTVLAWYVALFYFLPQPLRVPVFAVIFIFWRACYNAGIGWLLHNQSHHKLLTSWAKRYHVFDNPSSGNQPRPFLWKFLKQELEAKIPDDYKFENAPLEYNTWLLFRRVVDLILMSDFTSYCLFAGACCGRPVGESVAMTIARWSCGIGLILFNLWVKLDAHRVVKDYAWYWGDFFFLIDQNLTFDGVFELAPHPMYSVGYAGFYGISLMAASYKLLFVSILAHAAQFAFLSLVESPHIERTYNSPPPVKRDESVPPDMQRPSYKTRLMSTSGAEQDYPPIASSYNPSPMHKLIGLENIDLHRVTDVSVILMQLSSYAVAFMTPNTFTWRAIFVLTAVCWRLWYSIGIGFILDRQSNKKRWTRHFVKYGESTEEAWRQWKGIYHLSMVMCYSSFVCAAWKMYHAVSDWSYGMAILRHVIGIALIALHLWTVASIYESLGEFGWFFGDFFFDQAPKLNYDGIYRYLNNPERTIGLAGVWGAAIITWSKAIFFLAFLSHSLTLCFIQFVERPHMQKLYRQSLRETSGVSRNLQRSLPSPLQKVSGSMDRLLNESLDFVEDFIDATLPKIAAGFNTFINHYSKLFKTYPARVAMTRQAPDLADFNPKDYSLEIDSSEADTKVIVDQHSFREGESGRLPPTRTDSFKRLTVGYGTPIQVKWTAPLNHDKKDWIGLYMVADNASREVTNISSQGRWTATNNGEFDYAHAEQGILVSDQLLPAADRSDGGENDVMHGEVQFSGDKLWWTSGVFEFRYHRNGRHKVMAISLPFEIRIDRFDDDDIEIDDASGLARRAVEQALLSVVQNCFDRDPNVAPRTVDEQFGSTLEREGKFARRVVYAVQQMFGIEFAPAVVQADGNVRNLVWRICSAKKVLAPYSMSHSKGASTPT